MKQESDLVQAAAAAFGERVTLEQSALNVERGGAAAKLRPLAELYGLTVVERDLAWFLAEGVLTPQQGRAVVAAARELCRDLSAQMLTLVEAFGIPEHLVAAPIAGDWETYNKTDNRGELAGPWDPMSAVHHHRGGAGGGAQDAEDQPAGHSHITPGGPPAFYQQ